MVDHAGFWWDSEGPSVVFHVAMGTSHGEFADPLAAATGVSESRDTFHSCHFLVPPRAEHPGQKQGQKPIHGQTCPEFIVCSFFIMFYDCGFGP